MCLYLHLEFECCVFSSSKHQLVAVHLECNSEGLGFARFKPDTSKKPHQHDTAQPRLHTVCPLAGWSGQIVPGCEH